MRQVMRLGHQLFNVQKQERRLLVSRHADEHQAILALRVAIIPQKSARGERRCQQMRLHNFAINKVRRGKQPGVAFSRESKHRRHRIHYRMPHSIELTVIDLRRPPMDADELAQFLSPDEAARADRFVFPDLRLRFRIGRGMLRVILGKACGLSPGDLCFDYSPHGKPSLPGIHFNASHSGDLWACAVGGDQQIGLDIEQIRPMRDQEAIARRFFAPVECDAIVQYPAEERPKAFFRCWTRKEAYIKALGDGLSRGLSTFHVSCDEREVSPVHDTLSEEQWSLKSFVPAVGYAGALATRE